VSCGSGIRAKPVRFNDLRSSRRKAATELLSAEVGLRIRAAADKPRGAFNFSLRTGLGTDLAFPTLPKGGADGERLIVTAR
jgi:hypothetical protein